MIDGRDLSGHRELRGVDGVWAEAHGCMARTTGLAACQWYKRHWRCGVRSRGRGNTPETAERAGQRRDNALKCAWTCLCGESDIATYRILTVISVCECVNCDV